MDIFKDKSLVRSDGTQVEATTVLHNSIVGLYYSASWCPPCKAFTPELVNFHNELKKRKAQFEVVFLSFDKSEEEMMEYMEELHGNWFALPFGDPLIEYVYQRLFYFAI